MIDNKSYLQPRSMIWIQALLIPIITVLQKRSNPHLFVFRLQTVPNKIKTKNSERIESIKRSCSLKCLAKAKDKLKLNGQELKSYCSKCRLEMNNGWSSADRSTSAPLWHFHYRPGVGEWDVQARQKNRRGVGHPKVLPDEISSHQYCVHQ